MFDSINGLPLHALVVHAVVVLTPLTALAVFAAAISARSRTWMGWGLPALASVSLVLSFVATQSGGSLERRVEESALVRQHAELGDTLPWFLLAVTALAWALWLLGRSPSTAGEVGRFRGPRALRALAVVSVVAAVAMTVQVVRIGDAGARATWGDLPAASSTGPSNG